MGFMPRFSRTDGEHGGLPMIKRSNPLGSTSRLSTRRIVVAGALVVGLGLATVACGGDDSSDSERDQLLALLLAAAQGTNQDPGAALVAGALGENPNLLNELTDEQVEELLTLLESGQNSTETTGAPEAQGGDSDATVASASDDSDTTEAPSGGGNVSIPNLSIPPITIPTIDWDLLNDLLDEDDGNDVPTISIISIPNLSLPGGMPTLPPPSIVSIPSIPSP
jgi:hypothetical protein